jgi:L-ascorbate metabolism protein UlaG (beta-lactamase superfamily)
MTVVKFRRRLISGQSLIKYGAIHNTRARRGLRQIPLARRTIGIVDLMLLRRCGLLFFVLCSCHCDAASSQLAEQIRSHKNGLAVWWVGNAGWLIKADEVLIGIDLDLSAEEKIAPPLITAQDLAGQLDVAFVSHHHGDHCNVPTLKGLAAGGRTSFVLPRPCLNSVGQLGISQDRIIIPDPGHPFEIKGVKVEPIHAIHGNQDFTVLTREPDFIDSIRYNCGYVLSILGMRILHPGDSVLTEEHLGLKNIDVLFVSPTVHNMYTDRSMILINTLQPAYIFPQHFGTYVQTEENAFWTRGYPDELKLRLSRDLQSRYHKLGQGEMFRIK